MQNFKRLMVALDLSVMDQSVIQYTAVISEVVKPEKIYFIHVESDLELPESLKDKLSGFKLPKDEALAGTLEKSIKKHFKYSGSGKTSVQILEGNIAEQMLRWVKIKKIDLLIVGKKTTDGSGALPKKLTRLVNCSVLFVPESPPKNLNKILALVDLSGFSKRIIEESVRFASVKKDASVTCLHIYQVPQPYYSTGKTYNEVAEIIKAHSGKKFEKIISKIDTKSVEVKPVYALRKNNEVGKIVNNCVHEEKANFVIIGAKGRTMLSALLVGSFTEKLISGESMVPQLVLKDKLSKFGFLDAIQNI